MTACSGKALHEDLEVQGGWPLMFGAGLQISSSQKVLGGVKL